MTERSGTPSFHVLNDGAKLAYEILCSENVVHKTPIVLVGGMSSLRGDWDRLSKRLALTRPVVIFDHRGMGDSTFSPAKDEKMTIESLARDLLSLLTHLERKEMSICAFSMGGVITQQLIFLPFSPTNSKDLPFRLTHVFLTGTFPAPLKREEAMKNWGPFLVPTSKPRTKEQRREVARPMLEATFDSNWIKDPSNATRLEWWLERMITGRPTRTILMQASALGKFDFTGLHDKLSREPQILVIHGKLDEIVPFECAGDILRRIRRAKMVQVGNAPGQVPNLEFGHHWFEYFDVEVWFNVLDQFLSNGSMAQL